MDDAQKEIFKIKFTKLVILLNVDVFLFFLVFAMYILVPATLRVLAASLCLVVALILGIQLVRRYRETKAWLDTHA